MITTLDLRLRTRIRSRPAYANLLVVVASVVSVLLLASLAVGPSAAAVVAEGGGGDTELGNDSDSANVNNGSGEIAVKARGSKEAGTSSRRKLAVDDRNAALPPDQVTAMAHGMHHGSVDGRLSGDTNVRDTRRLSTQRLENWAPDPGVTAISLNGASDRTAPPFSSAKRTAAWGQQAGPAASVADSGSRLVVATRWQAILFASILMNVVLGSLVVFRRFGSRTASRLAGPFELVTPREERPVGRESEKKTANSKPLSDEEIVRRLLEEHDGQMRQSEIVEEREWSKAKVSRILCEMDSSGEIVKIQIGRENLICLDGQQPDIAKPMT